MNKNSIRFKIVIYSVLCVVIISVCGNLYLFSYLNKIIVEKADRIDEIYLDNLSSQIERSFEDLFDLGVNCANHKDIVKAMMLPDANSVNSKKIMLQAQKVMNSFISSTQLGSYINKMIVVNDNAVWVQASAKHFGFVEDVDTLLQRELVGKEPVETSLARFQLKDSITPYEQKGFSILLKIDNLEDTASNAYLYMEINTNLVQKLFDSYEHLNYLFLWDEADINSAIGSVNDPPALALLTSKEHGFTHEDGETFKLNKKPIAYTNLSLYNYTNISALSIAQNNMIYTLLMIFFLTIVVAIGIIAIVSKWITKPISRLINRIKKIAENDFSFDPTIECTNDEIGEIGKVVNEMVQSVANLMRESIRASEEKTNIEMAMLQAQVNPHFLYNTLDSIHWMAVIQKAPGISNMTKSLSNLLKNMSKGFSDKIQLHEELSLLADYITIQGIRYAETFEYQNNIPKEYLTCRIIKMTLQPIVENAIFHGIEPSGRLGIIRVDAYENEEYLFITVEDNGIGMEQAQMESLLKEDTKEKKNTMSGIGVSNVNRRLKLVYGNKCGLLVESKIDEYTKITIKIRKETD